jgi:nucleotide-binding universal stress UspA family protein
MTNVLIAVDGTPLDRLLARRALGLFGADAHYVLVNVSDQNVPLTVVPLAYGAASALSAPELSRLAEIDDAAAQTAEHVAEEAAHAAGLNDAITIGEVGDPVNVVLSAAEEHSADVIVVGTKDR